MRLKVKKLYRKLAEVRSYDVEKCYVKNESLIIEYNNDLMEIKHEDLKRLIKSVSKEFPSKVGGKPYKLFGYEWVVNQ